MAMKAIDGGDSLDYVWFEMLLVMLVLQLAL